MFLLVAFMSLVCPCRAIRSRLCDKGWYHQLYARNCRQQSSTTAATTYVTRHAAWFGAHCQRSQHPSRYTRQNTPCARPPKARNDFNYRIVCTRNWRSTHVGSGSGSGSVYSIASYVSSSSEHFAFFGFGIFRLNTLKVVKVCKQRIPFACFCYLNSFR